MSGADRAVAACVDYDRWATEIRVLTEAIGECTCPAEDQPFTHVAGDDGATFRAPTSCFRRASAVRLPGGPMPDDAPRRLYLHEVAARVKDCAACTRLCELIEARRHARRQWGVAKRRIRAIARSAGSAIHSAIHAPEEGSVESRKSNGGGGIRTPKGQGPAAFRGPRHDTRDGTVAYLPRPVSDGHCRPVLPPRTAANPSRAAGTAIHSAIRAGGHHA